MCAASYITLRLCLLAISSIASILQILPYTCTGIIAAVLSVIRLSILFTSIVKVSFSISQKTGVSPFLTMAWVVEANVKGVVITSPLRFIA